MKYILVITITIWVSFSVYSQKGTVIVAAVAKNGIIIAADSRAIIGANNHFVAYIDSVSKILRLKDFPIAHAGHSTLNGKIIDQILVEYNKTHPQPKDVELTFKDFLKYMYEKYKIDSSEMFIGGGYYSNGKSFLIGFTGTHGDIYYDGFIISDSSSILSKYLIPYQKSADYTCEQLRPIIENTINNYAIKAGKTDEIGGPISVVKITDKNKIIYLQNDFSKPRYKDFTELVHLIQSHVIKLTPIVVDGEKKAINLLKLNPAYKPHQ
ncbi:MAG: hypothetical protein JJE22_03400 [Bacteroidia bacterium]|nr:hypothetical protein [Bacteroidia bacterium]